jgi:hypothetical protein
MYKAEFLVSLEKNENVYHLLTPAPNFSWATMTRAEQY